MIPSQKIPEDESSKKGMGRSFTTNTSKAASFPWVDNPSYGATPYREQGDNDMNTPENLKKRQSIKYDVKVAREINKLWHLLKKNPQGMIEKQSYFNIYLRLCKAFNPDFIYEEGLKVVEQDFHRDTRGGSTLSFDGFYESIFELADLWCDDISGESYARLLAKAFRRITVKLRRIPGHDSLIKIPPILRAYNPSDILPPSIVTRAMVFLEKKGEEKQEDKELDFTTLITSELPPALEPVSSTTPRTRTGDDEDDEDGMYDEEDDEDMRLLQQETQNRQREEQELLELQPYIAIAEKNFRARGLYAPTHDVVSKLENEDEEVVLSPRRDRRTTYEPHDGPITLADAMMENVEGYDLDIDQVQERRAIILAEAKELYDLDKRKKVQSLTSTAQSSAERSTLRDNTRKALQGVISLLNTEQREEKEYSDDEEGVYVLAPLDQVVGFTQPTPSAIMSVTQEAESSYQVVSSANANANTTTGSNNTESEPLDYITGILCTPETVLSMKDDTMVLQKVPGIEKLLSCTSTAIAAAVVERAKVLYDQTTSGVSTKDNDASSSTTSDGTNASKSKVNTPTQKHHNTNLKDPKQKEHILLSLKNKFKCVPFGDKSTLPSLHQKPTVPVVQPTQRPPSAQVPVSKMKPVRPEGAAPAQPQGRALRRGLVNLAKNVVEPTGKAPVVRDDVPTENQECKLTKFVPEPYDPNVLEDIEDEEEELLWGGGHGALLATRSLLKYEILELANRVGIEPVVIQSLESSLERTSKQSTYMYSDLALAVSTDYDDPSNWSMYPHTKLPHKNIHEVITSRMNSIVEQKEQNQQYLQTHIASLKDQVVQLRLQEQHAEADQVEAKITILSCGISSDMDTVNVDVSAVSSTPEKTDQAVNVPEVTPITAAESSILPSKRTHTLEHKPMSIWLSGKSYPNKHSLCLSLQVLYGSVYITCDDLVNYLVKFPNIELSHIVDKLCNGEIATSKEMVQLLRYRLLSPEVKTFGYIIGDLPCDVADVIDIQLPTLWPPEVILTCDISNEDVLLQNIRDRENLSRAIANVSVDIVEDALQSAVKLKAGVAKQNILQQLTNMKHVIRHGGEVKRNLKRVKWELAQQQNCNDSDDDDEPQEEYHDSEDEEDMEEDEMDHGQYHDDEVYIEEEYQDDIEVSANTWLNHIANIDYYTEEGELMVDLPYIPSTLVNFPETRLEKALVTSMIAKEQKLGQYQQEVQQYIDSHASLPVDLVTGIRSVHVYDYSNVNAPIPVPEPSPMMMDEDEDMHEGLDLLHEVNEFRESAAGELPNIDEGNEEDEDSDLNHSSTTLSGKTSPRDSNASNTSNNGEAAVKEVYPLPPTRILHPLAESAKLFAPNLQTKTLHQRIEREEDDEEESDQYSSQQQYRNDQDMDGMEEEEDMYPQVQVKITILPRPTLVSKLASDDNYKSYYQVREYANGEEEPLSEDTTNEDLVVELDVDFVSVFTSESNAAIPASYDTNLAYTSSAENIVELESDVILGKVEARKDILKSLQNSSADVFLQRLDYSYVPHSIEYVSPGVLKSAAYHNPSLTPTSVYPTSDVGLLSLVYPSGAMLEDVHQLSVALNRYVTEEEQQLKLLLRNWNTTPSCRTQYQHYTLSGYDTTVDTLKSIVHILEYRTLPSYTRPCILTDVLPSAEDPNNMSDSSNTNNMYDELNEHAHSDIAFPVALPQSVLLDRQLHNKAIIKPEYLPEEDEELPLTTVTAVVYKEISEEMKVDDSDINLPSATDRISILSNTTVSKDEYLEQVIAEQTLLVEEIDKSLLQTDITMNVVNTIPPPSLDSTYAPIYAFAQRMSWLDHSVLDLTAQAHVLHTPANHFTLSYIPDADACATMPVYSATGTNIQVGGYKPPCISYDTYVPSTLPVPIPYKALDLPGDVPVSSYIYKSAFGSYCPVCVMHGKLQKGRNEYSVVYHGQHWIPCSSTCQETFVASSSEYIDILPKVDNPTSIVLIHGFPKVGKTTLASLVSKNTGVNIITSSQIFEWCQVEIEELKEQNSLPENEQDVYTILPYNWVATKITNATLVDCDNIHDVFTATQFEQIIEYGKLPVVGSVLLAIDDIEGYDSLLSNGKEASKVDASSLTSVSSTNSMMNATDAEEEDDPEEPEFIPSEHYDSLTAYQNALDTINSTLVAYSSETRKHNTFVIPPNRTSQAQILREAEMFIRGLIQPLYEVHVSRHPRFIVPTETYMDALSTAESMLTSNEYTVYQNVVNSPSNVEDVINLRQLVVGHQLHCPICYLTEKLLIPAKPTLRIRYCSAVYGFCTSKHANMFLSTPELYHVPNISEEQLMKCLPVPKIWVLGGKASGKTTSIQDLMKLTGITRHIQLKNELVVYITQQVLRHLTKSDYKILSQLELEVTSRREQRAKRAGVEELRAINAREREERIRERVQAYIEEKKQEYAAERKAREEMGEEVSDDEFDIEVPSDIEAEVETEEVPSIFIDESETHIHVLQHHEVTLKVLRYLLAVASEGYSMNHVSIHKTLQSQIYAELCVLIQKCITKHSKLYTELIKKTIEWINECIESVHYQMKVAAASAEAQMGGVDMSHLYNNTNTNINNNPDEEPVNDLPAQLQILQKRKHTLVLTLLPLLVGNNTISLDLLKAYMNYEEKKALAEQDLDEDDKPVTVVEKPDWSYLFDVELSKNEILAALHVDEDTSIEMYMKTITKPYPSTDICLHGMYIQPTDEETNTTCLSTLTIANCMEDIYYIVEPVMQDILTCVFTSGWIRLSEEQRKQRVLTSTYTNTFYQPKFDTPKHLVINGVSIYDKEEDNYSLVDVLPPLELHNDVLTHSNTSSSPYILEVDFLPVKLQEVFLSFIKTHPEYLPSTIVHLQGEEDLISVRLQRQIVRASCSIISKEMRDTARENRREIYRNVLRTCEKQLQKLDVIEKLRADVHDIRVELASIVVRETNAQAVLDEIVAFQKKIATSRGIDINDSEEDLASDLLHATPGGEESYASILSRVKAAREKLAEIKLEIAAKQEQIVSTANTYQSQLLELKDVHVLLNSKQILQTQKQHAKAVKLAVSSVVGDTNEEEEENDKGGEDEDEGDHEEEEEDGKLPYHVDHDIAWLINEHELLQKKKSRSEDNDDDDEEEEEDDDTTEILAKRPTYTLSPELILEDRQRITNMYKNTKKILHKDTVSMYVLSEKDLKALDLAASQRSLHLAEDADNKCRQAYVDTSNEAETVIQTLIELGVSAYISIQSTFGDEPVHVLNAWYQLLLNDPLINAKKTMKLKHDFSAITDHVQLATPGVYDRVSSYRVALRVWRALQPYFARYRALFSKPYVLSSTEASTLLRWGAAVTSPIGFKCPISTYIYNTIRAEHEKQSELTNNTDYKNTLPTLYSTQQDLETSAYACKPGTGYYPIMWRNVIYYCRSEAARQVFASDPYRYTRDLQVVVEPSPCIMLLGTNDVDAKRVAQHITDIRNIPNLSTLDAIQSVSENTYVWNNIYKNIYTTLTNQSQYGKATKNIYYQVSNLADAEEVELVDGVVPDNMQYNSVALPLSLVLKRVFTRTPKQTSVLKEMIRELLLTGQLPPANVVALAMSRLHYSGNARCNGIIWHSLPNDLGLNRYLESCSVYPHIVAEVSALANAFGINTAAPVTSNIVTVHDGTAIAHGTTEAYIRNPFPVSTRRLPLPPSSLPSYKLDEEQENPTLDENEEEVPYVPIGGMNTSLYPLGLDMNGIEYAYDAGAFEHPAHYIDTLKCDVHATLPNNVYVTQDDKGTSSKLDLTSLDTLPKIKQLPKEKDVLSSLIVSLGQTNTPFAYTEKSLPMSFVYTNVSPVLSYMRIVLPQSSYVSQALYASYNILMYSYKRSKYLNALNNSLPAPVIATSAHSIQSVLKSNTFDALGYCPVALQNGKLMHYSLQNNYTYRLVQINNQFLYASSANAQKLILHDPNKYKNVTLPKTLPVAISARKRHLIKVASCEYAGACPVELYRATQKANTNIVKGDPIYTVSYDKKIYRLSSASNYKDFMLTPWVYTNAELPLELAPSKSDEDIATLIQQGLPEAYLQATVASQLHTVLTSLAHNKVVYPGLSVTQSQLLYMAFALKVANAKTPEEKEYAVNKLRSFLNTCELVKSISKIDTSMNSDMEMKLDEYSILVSHFASSNEEFVKASAYNILSRYFE